jgi:hypothetical protein
VLLCPQGQRVWEAGNGRPGIPGSGARSLIALAGAGAHGRSPGEGPPILRTRKFGGGGRTAPSGSHIMERGLAVVQVVTL